MEYLSQSHFLSLAMDISAKKQESLFVRSSLYGVCNQHFLWLVEPESMTSNDLFGVTEDILAILTKSDIDVKHKLIALDSDGASNMLGKNKGVGNLLKDKNPDISKFTIWTIAWSLPPKMLWKLLAPNSMRNWWLPWMVCTIFISRVISRGKASEKLCRSLRSQGTCLHVSLGHAGWHTENRQSEPGTSIHLENESYFNAKAEGLVKLLTNRLWHSWSWSRWLIIQGEQLYS